MHNGSKRWIRTWATLIAATALGGTAAAPAHADCPYPSYVECLQAGETVDFCKSHNLNCGGGGSAGQSGGGGGQSGGGDPDPSGDDCQYGTYVECLQSGHSVDFCKTHALDCDQGGPGGGGAGGDEDPCAVMEDEFGVGCDGDPTWVTLSDPYDIVLSQVQRCPYDSYIECLQAGETVDFCKRHQLNCHPGQLTQAQATVDFNARQCDDEPLCLCAQSTGQITFYGETVIKGDEICLEISSFSYNGPFKNKVNQEITEELDAIGWEFCMPLECI
jgi:hypothetical protein